MNRTRFVKPETTRLPISGGDYVDVKRRLNQGEREDFFATVAPFDADGKTALNRRVVRTARLVTYLVGWSLVNDGTPVPMSPDMSEEQRTNTIRGLDPDTFDEIHEAIVKHEAAIDAEVAAAKNESATPSASEAPSL